MTTPDRKARAEALAKALGPEWNPRSDPYNPDSIMVSDGEWVTYDFGYNFQVSTRERTLLTLQAIVWISVVIEILRAIGEM